MRKCMAHLYDGFGDCPRCKDEKITDLAVRNLDKALAGKNWTKEATDMTAPTEQQLNDPKWWDENAPEWATMAGQIGAARRWVWGNLGQYQYFGEEKIYSYAGAQNWALHDLRMIGKRPAKPEPKEWDGKTFPVPLGQKCECTFAVEHHDTWHRGEAVFHGIDPEGREYMVIDTGIYQVCYRSLDYVRPIRTQAERDRDDLASLCRAKFNQQTSSSNPYLWHQIADTIIAAGWRKGDS